MAASRANFTGDGITGHAMMFRLLIAAAVWLSVFCQQAGAHAGDALIPVQLAVAEWATAHQSRDIEALSSLLTDDFNGSAAARDAYFAALSLRPVKQVILRHASYQIERTHSASQFSRTRSLPRTADSLCPDTHFGAWE